MPVDLQASQQRHMQLHRRQEAARRQLGVTSMQQLQGLLYVGVQQGVRLPTSHVRACVRACLRDARARDAEAWHLMVKAKRLYGSHRADGKCLAPRAKAAAVALPLSTPRLSINL